jgi:hypothetical protein
MLITLYRPEEIDQPSPLKTKVGRNGTFSVLKKKTYTKMLLIYL